MLPQPTSSYSTSLLSLTPSTSLIFILLPLVLLPALSQFCSYSLTLHFPPLTLPSPHPTPFTSSLPHSLSSPQSIHLFSPLSLSSPHSPLVPSQKPFATRKSRTSITYCPLISIRWWGSCTLMFSSLGFLCSCRYAFSSSNSAHMSPSM